MDRAQPMLDRSSQNTEQVTGAQAAVSTPRAPVLEAFASIQGEGLFLGEPQVFLRLAGCPLRCRYCDTPHSWQLNGREADDWHTPFQAACRIAEVEREAGGSKRTVSLTGGEPLAYPDFAVELASLIGSRALHLETAGVHPAALERVLPATRHVSLDLKLMGDLDAPVALPGADGLAARLDGFDAAELAAAAPSGEPTPALADELRAARRACLNLLARRDPAEGATACAKLVVTERTSELEAVEALDDVAELAPELTVFVQPATATARTSAPGSELVEALVEAALERRLATRSLPQIHPLLGLP
ncbi:MAG: 7-carboxy-7-deazaguanine synthase QueE [Planctomycetota bacterium]